MDFKNVEEMSCDEIAEEMVRVGQEIYENEDVQDVQELKDYLAMLSEAWDDKHLESLV